MEYKDTLLMPKTEFPMRGNLPNREPKMQEQWAEMNIYEKVQNVRKAVRYSSCMMDLHMPMAIFTWDMP